MHSLLYIYRYSATVKDSDRLDPCGQIQNEVLDGLFVIIFNSLGR